MNVITLTGNATKDIEIRYNPSGTCFANGSIAVGRDRKNQHNEYETDFFNFLAIGKLGEVMANHIKKGDRFGITGRLQNRVWEKDDGSKQYFTEVVVNGFDFPNKRTGSQNSQNSNDSNHPYGNAGFNPKDGEIDVKDDDLPF